MDLCDRYLDASGALNRAEEAVEEALRKVLGLAGGDDAPWDSFSVDPCDWDGISIELRDAEPGLEFTDEQLDQVWALGFTVLRIDYRGHHDRPMAGDWWRVKGLPVGECPCSVHRRRRRTVAGEQLAQVELDQAAALATLTTEARGAR